MLFFALRAHVCVHACGNVCVYLTVSSLTQVPMDQPEVALEMFNGFVHGSDFSSEF
jgi:hypothetical protein